MKELIEKHKEEIVTFNSLYKDYATYENDKIIVKFTKDYRSNLYLNMSVSDINSEGDIYEITYK